MAFVEKTGEKRWTSSSSSSKMGIMQFGYGNFWEKLFRVFLSVSLFIAALLKLGSPHGATLFEQLASLVDVVAGIFLWTQFSRVVELGLLAAFALGAGFSFINEGCACFGGGGLSRGWLSLLIHLWFFACAACLYLLGRKADQRALRKVQL